MPQKRCPIDADPRNHNGEMMCLAKCTKSEYNFQCTRIKGHKGKHHAHGRVDAGDPDEKSNCCKVWK